MRTIGDVTLATIYAFLEACDVLHLFPYAREPAIPDCPSWRLPGSERAAEIREKLQIEQTGTYGASGRPLSGAGHRKDSSDGTDQGRAPFIQANNGQPSTYNFTHQPPHGYSQVSYNTTIGNGHDQDYGHTQGCVQDQGQSPALFKSSVTHSTIQLGHIYSGHGQQSNVGDPIAAELLSPALCNPYDYRPTVNPSTQTPGQSPSAGIVVSKNLTSKTLGHSPSTQNTVSNYSPSTQSLSANVATSRPTVEYKPQSSQFPKPYPSVYAQINATKNVFLAQEKTHPKPDGETNEGFDIDYWLGDT